LGFLEDSLSAASDISVTARVRDVASGAEGGVGPIFVFLSSAAFQLKLPKHASISIFKIQITRM